MRYEKSWKHMKEIDANMGWGDKYPDKLMLSDEVKGLELSQAEVLDIVECQEGREPEEPKNFKTI